MKQLRVHVDECTYLNLKQLVDAMNRSRHVEGFPAKLTVGTLLQMLAQDCAMVVTRPGSWEGANMADILQGHGYLR